MRAWLTRTLDPERSRVARAVTDAVEPEDGPAALRRRATETARDVNRAAGSLPVEAVVVARQVIDMALEVSEHPDVSLEARIAVNGVLGDYLPTTLRTFQAVSAADPGPGPREHLIDQLDALRTSMLETRDAARDDDLRALETQSFFLSTKFGGTDL